MRILFSNPFVVCLPLVRFYYYLLTCLLLFVLTATNVEAQNLSDSTPPRTVGPQIQPFVWSATRTPGSIAVNRDLKYQAMTPAQLVQEVFVKTGACVNVSNVTTRIYGWNGSKWTYGNTGNRGLAYFSAPADCNFPIKQGLILGTGNVHNAEGNNSSDNTMGTSPNNGHIGGDADLNKLITTSSYKTTDVGVLEFDFVPTGTIMEFKYIFASEEYPEFANGEYNDVFGFFVNRLTPTVGTKQNIALLPTSHTGDYVVSINNVNNGAWSSNTYTAPHSSYSTVPKNANYFVKSPKGSVTTEFDGHTVVLTARYENMVPCETYHLKLAIANVRDYLYGSAVFLQAHSFDAGQSLSVYGNKIEGMEYIFKNCDQNFFRVIRTELNNQDVTVQMNYEGAAVNGTHYTDLNGNPLPASITFAPTEFYRDIWFKATPLAIHGSKFTVKLWCPCADMNIAATKDIHIYDNYKSTFSSSVASACTGLANGRITVSGSGSAGEYEFSLNGGAWQKTTGGSYTFLNLPPNTYTIRARDYGSCAGAYPNPLVVVLKNLTANAGPDQVQCFSGATSFTMAANQYSAASGETGVWSIVSSTPAGFGVANIVNTTQYNTTVNVPQIYSSVTLRWRLNSPAGCSDYDDVVLKHYPKFLVSETLAAHKNVSCNGGNNGSVTLAASGGSGSGYQYSKDNLAWASNNVLGNLSAGTHTLYARDGGGCSAPITVTITEPAVLNLIKTAHTNVSCYNGNNGSVTVSASGGTPPYKYRINGGVWVSATTFGTLPADDYTVDVTDSKDCITPLPFTITQPILLNFTATKTDVLCNGGNTGSITVNATGGTAPYKYSINGGAFGASNTFGGLLAKLIIFR